MSLLICFCLAALVGASQGAARHVEVLIVGAGPAGLQWATLLQQAKFTNYVVLEKGPAAASFFQAYPRSRRLISNNKCRVGKGKSRDFALRHDWNSLIGTNLSFCDKTSEFYASADHLVEYLQEVAANLRVEYNAEVVGTSWHEGQHVVHLADGRTWTCQHLVVASGFAPEPLPAEPWTKEKRLDVYTYATFPDLDVTGRAPFCDDRDVFVVGNGNAAFETANMLAACASRVHMIFRRPPRFSSLTHYVGDVRMHLFGIADRYLLKSLDSLIHMPPPDGSLHAWNHQLTSLALEFDAAIIFCGGFSGKTMNPPASPLTALVDTMNFSSKSKFPEVGAFFSDPSVKNKWYAGNLMHGRDYRSGAGGFIHGFRYLIRSQMNYMMAKHYGRPFPSKSFSGPRRHEDLISHIISRYQNSSALYQLHGHVRDLVVQTPDHSSYVYVEEVPRYWADDALAFLDVGEQSCRCEVGFDYGHTEDVPGAWNFDFMFAEEREDRTPSLFLHPVIVAADHAGVQTHHHGSEDFRAAWEDGEEVERCKIAVQSCLTSCFSVSHSEL